jgi:two-component system phosphate regulon sensor histidine kinase PhoR
MVAANPERKALDLVLAGIAGRLFENRWLVVAAGLLLLALALAHVVAPVPAGTVFLGLLVLVAVLPRPRAAERLPVTTRPALPIAAEIGVQAFANALPAPCFLLDRRGIVRYANERGVAAFSIHQGESLTFRLRNPDLVAAFHRVANGGPPELVEFAERIPTERWFAAWFADLTAPRRPSGEFIVLTLEDLSERRRTDRIRVDFVANASHELRTPLASLTGFIETLQGPAREDPVARSRFLQIMHEQATRMSRLVDDLMSLSRIEMKAHVRPVNRIDLTSVVRHVADALEPLAQELGVTIETVLPDGPVELTADRDEIIQVFENLIENACKYGQSGKLVIVTLAQGAKATGPSVTVRDFGPGIPEEHVPRLTERFYRVDVEDSRRHRGTGLGLAIVKHILARHHARMTVESRLGEGTSFVVTFPPAASALESAPGEKTQIKTGV